LAYFTGSTWHFVQARQIKPSQPVSRAVRHCGGKLLRQPVPVRQRTAAQQSFTGACVLPVFQAWALQLKSKDAPSRYAGRAA
jgi:hypothetical protein